MKKVFNYSIILASLIIFSAFSLNYGKKVDLKLNLKKGDKFYLLTIAEQDITQTMMGQEIKIGQTIEMGYDYDVVEVLSNGNYKIKSTYTKIVYKQDSQYGSVDYDSDNADSEASGQAKAFAALKGLSFYFTCDEKGNVTDVEGTEDMLNAVIASYGDELPEEKKEEVRKSLKGQFGDKAMKSTLANVMNIYPEKAIKVGKSWSREINLNVGMPMTLANTWTLNSVKKGKALISVETTIKTNPEAEPMEVQGMSMKYDLSGTQTGEMTVDIKTGLTEKSVVDQEFGGKMIMSGGMLPEEMEVPITIISKITLTMTEK